VSRSGQQGKPFTMPKQLVREAYRRVKASKGAAGVDHVSMGEFEEDLRGNLYKIWNRMSSGTYFPPPVKAAEIPKSHGGTRILGVPAVGGGIAQTVVALQLEARTESIFHPDSCGYRPGKSAHDALAKCRQRCWKGNWVVDLGIEKFFGSLDHDLVVRTVEANTGRKWVLLYVKRWLKAPLQMPGGTPMPRG
jgi:RNA-directed DNA polymerase